MNQNQSKTTLYTNDEIALIVPILTKGGSILYPTDTIWGIGCDACNVKSVDNIFKLKQTQKDKGLVLLVSDNEMLHQYVNRVHPKIQNLLDYHTRPVTVVYENAKNLPEEVISNDGSIAIRIVQDIFCQEMIRALGRPIVSTTANISTHPVPKNFKDIDTTIINGVDYVVKHRQDEVTNNLPSVMVKLSAKNELDFIRR